MTVAPRLRRALAALSLLWCCSGAGAAMPWAVEAQAMLARAAEQGLDAADYRVDPAAADADAALQAAVVRYLRHLHQGRVTPKDLGFRVVAAPLPQPKARVTNISESARRVMIHD